MLPYKEFTDEEIISSLEVIATTCNCNECKIRSGRWGTCNCSETTANAALDLINRQKSEIERLNKKVEELSDVLSDTIRIRYAEAKTEAYKEFAKKIYIEINEALAQNHKVKVERINNLMARGIKSNDEFCYEIDGKILALRGISEFIDNILKEMMGNKQ